MSSPRIRTAGPYVIAMVALILALTGTSIALPGKNSVDSSDIRNHSVKNVDVKNNTLAGKQIAEQKLGEVRLATSAVEARNVLWAVVKNPGKGNDAGIIRAGQPNTAAIEGNGLVNVGFGRDISNCSWTATSQAGGYATTSPAGNGFNATISVRTRNAAGNLTDQPFTVQVVC